MKENETEKKIIDAAEVVFQSRGYDGARMQDIADVAQINKALLHYYYRSKDRLFETVLKTLMNQFFSVIFSGLSEQLSLKEFIEKFYDGYIGFLLKHQKLPLFIITEINRNPKFFSNILKEANILDRFKAKIEEEVKLGNIMPISPTDFIMNLISWAIFPFLSRAVWENVFNMSEAEFLATMERRRKLLPEMFWKSLQ